MKRFMVKDVHSITQVSGVRKMLYPAINTLAAASGRYLCGRHCTFALLQFNCLIGIGRHLHKGLRWPPVLRIIALNLHSTRLHIHTRLQVTDV